MIDDDLVTLLTRYHHGDATAGEQLFQAVQDHFHKTLRPALVRQFGAAARDTSLRYSAMVNDFFARVLERQPDSDPFWQAKSLRALSGFAQVVIRRDMLDVLRRRQRRTALDPDELEQLASARAEHFRNDCQLDFEWTLARLDEWERRDDPWPQRARVLSYFYVFGMDYAEIEHLEGVPRKRPPGESGPTLYKTMEKAVAALRAESTSAGHRATS